MKQNQIQINKRLWGQAHATHMQKQAGAIIMLFHSLQSRSTKQNQKKKGKCPRSEKVA